MYLSTLEALRILGSAANRILFTGKGFDHADSDAFKILCEAADEVIESVRFNKAINELVG